MNAQRLYAVRAAARQEAELALEAAGFRREDDGSYSGTLTEWPVRVVLPREFPDVLPAVVLRERFDSLAHVDQSGKICVAPDTGVLLDATRPADLVRDTLQRANDVLTLPQKVHRAHRLGEFNAYWPSLGSSPMASICPVPLVPAEITIAVLAGPTPLHLAAPNIELANQWATRTGRRVIDQYPGFGMPLKSPLHPPAFGEIATVRDACRRIGAHLDAAVANVFQRWFEKRGLPTLVMMSQPVSPDEHFAVFAAYLPGPRPENAKKWTHGFRKGRAPRIRQVAFAALEPVERRNVNRMDAPFLVTRGGGDPALLHNSVALVGGGSVGSALALLLGATGLGAIHLVDQERLEAANFQRHALGAADLGRTKVEGLQELLHSHHPHMDVTLHHGNVLDLLANQPNAFDRFSLVVVAIGQETIERRINDLLRDQVPRVHVWLEPHGIGGHTLITGLQGKRGCYGCLFRADDQWGLVNMSAFAAPGQHLQRSFAGCAGVFTPFGAADAQRAAVEACRQIVRALGGDIAIPELTCWQVSRDAFLAAGGVLSVRGQAMTPGSTETTPLSSYACSACTDG